MTAAHTPGPWRWQGEDYRGGWGWQMLVGPNGEGLIVGQDQRGGPCSHLCAHRPVDPALCVTGMLAAEVPHVEPVHVFGEANARLIAAAPDLLATVDWLRQTYHRAHHEGALETCEKSTCQAARDAMAKASPP